jgi:hypothetical protein
VSEVAFKRRPDESEKGTVTLSKVSQAERGMGRAFESIMIGRSAFCGRQNFHSIMIIIPLHVSKYSPVLKTLTSYSTGLNIPMGECFFFG